MIKLISFIIFLLLKNLVAYPSGAPLSACGTLRPSHSGASLLGQEDSPFNISVSEFSNSTLKETGHFKGFLLEARWNNEAIGEWITNVSNTRTLDCFNSKHSAVTHKLSGLNRLGFQNVTFIWSYPNITRLDKFHFIATVVKDFNVVYMNLKKSLKGTDFF